MSTAGAGPSRARAAARLGVEFALFAGLLFVSRFVLRGYLALPLDEECHIGGIALDVLAKGIRFPFVVYVQSDYDSGSLISGLLAAGSFSVLGRNLLALKLVTHLVAAVGAVAALALLRGSLRDLRLTSRRARWTAIAVLAIAVALAPEAQTVPAMCTIGIGSPLDGSVMDTLLLTLFASRLRDRSALRIGVFWALVALALFFNRATLPIIPVLALAEVALARRTPRKLLAAVVGFLLGASRDLIEVAEQYTNGWRRLFGKVHAHDFPGAFLESIWTGSEYRLELIALWALALAFGIAVLIRCVPRFRAWWVDDAAAPPWTLLLVVGAAATHVTALLIMATGGFDYYTIYAYPLIAILLALLVAWGCSRVATRLPAAGTWIYAGAVVAVLLAYRPLAMEPSFDGVRALWRNKTGAACSWRLAEGFRREYEAGLAPGETLQQHVIDRCRSLSDHAQVLDCVGGMARDLHHNFSSRIENGAPPAALTPEEARAYAYYYGVRLNGELTACTDLADERLRAQCTAAAQLDCIARGGWGSHFSADPSGPPHCEIAPPPMDGYWTALRTTMFTTTYGVGMRVLERREEDQFPGCRPVFDACYTPSAR
jgi:hypothetical protein